MPKRPAPFVPYIYAQEQLRRLLEATDSYQRCLGSIEPLTMRTIVLLLYGAGLRVGEAINLDRADIDHHNAVLTVRRTKFFKSRLVPFGPQLGSVLTEYGQRPQLLRCAGADQPAFFTTRSGARLRQGVLQASFRRLREYAGIRRPGGARYQPRLHDLRHTFAVHRLTAWYRQGADVQRLLHHLSVYLGHAHLAATQVYLTMTPELLHEAGARFERYALGEDSHA